MSRWSMPTNSIVIAAVVLLTGIPVSLGVAMLLSRQVDATARSQFNRVAEQVASEFYAWTFRPIYGMNGLRGAYAASEEVSASEFRDYYLSRDLPVEFPGMQNIGFATPTDDGEWPFLHMEPREHFGDLLGTDLAADETTQRALDRAVSENQSLLLSMQGRISSDPALHVWVVPVYHNGMPRETAQQRRDAIQGVITAHFEMTDLVSRLEAELDGMAVLTVSQRVQGNDDVRLELLRCGDEADADGHWLARSDLIDVGGASLELSLAPTRAFLVSKRSAAPVAVAVCGVVLTATLATLLISMSRSRQQAVELARAMDGEVRRLSLVARYTSNVVIITDCDQNIVWVNHAFTELTGYTIDEAIGRRPGDLLQYDDTSPTTRAAIREALRQGEGYRGEILNVSKTGKPYWVRLDIQPVRDRSGRVTEFVAVESDLTQEKEQQRLLSEAVLAAEHASESKSRFLSGMSHEIRTPLNGIIGFADLLRSNANDGDAELQAEWIEVIHGSAQHLLALLNDVLDLSKLDAEQMEVVLAPSDPRSLVEGAANLLQSRAHELGISLEVFVDDAVPISIRTDATRLRQIVMNLVSNAVKFTHRGSVSVEVSMVEAAGATPRMRVAVRDTGIGIAPEQIGKLFVPFQQADHTVAEEFGGTGLGLSISRALANRLGGDITVASAEGVGSCFTLEIEAPSSTEDDHVATPCNHEAEPDRAHEGVLEGRRVLVIDDVSANRDIARIVLSRAGAEVTTAEDGEQALRFAEAASFDLVLMDIQMPRMNGMEATRRLRASGCRAPVLALTAFSSGADRDECLRAGMDDFLPKPFEPAMLLESAARWVRVKPAGVGDNLGVEPFDDEMREVADDWLSALPDRLSDAGDALRRGDMASAARVAHAIKGSGGTLGFPELTQPSMRLESACLSGDPEAAHAALADIRDVHDELEAKLNAGRPT
ncbi:MAG: response regulator [Planctomycetota bacterium]